jgi:hypothetical protein
VLCIVKFKENIYKEIRNMFKQRNYLLKAFFAVFILLSANTLSAQTIIKGSVKDAKTQETLPGVAISVKNSTIGVITNENGDYELNVGPGKYTIVTSYLSYQPMEITDVEVKRGEPTIVNIPMKESEHALGEV